MTDLELNIDHVDRDKFFLLLQQIIIGGIYLSYTKSWFDYRQVCIFKQVCNSWNTMPEHIATASSLNIFKNKLDSQLVGKKNKKNFDC